MTIVISQIPRRRPFYVGDVGVGVTDISGFCVGSVVRVVNVSVVSGSNHYLSEEQALKRTGGLIRKILQILQNQNPFRERLAVVAIQYLAVAMAAGEMMQLMLLLQLRIGPFCHICNDWWLLRCGRIPPQKDLPTANPYRRPDVYCKAD